MEEIGEKEKGRATSKNLIHLLSSTKLIVKHHNDLMVAKGEHFNLFSVLNIETKENKTHSAFITELLDPNGSHRMGAIFLDLFLQVVKPEVFDENEEGSKEKFPDKVFVTDNVYVRAEHPIGAINYCEKEGEDEANASGGRIDIFLKDINDTVICIENKIHAIDQNKQIQRYCNYKTSKNTVFYLTLKGDEPIKESKLKLISGKHFHKISYRDHILHWLELCLKEVSNFTALREAINQYILLIKKLTNTMNTKQEKELLDIMMANLEESEFISNNYDKALVKLRDNFRKSLKAELEKHLCKEKYTIKNGSPVKNKFSQLWIHINNSPSPEFLFGVESFSGTGHKNGVMFVGLYDKNNSPLIAAIPEENRLNEGWKQVRYIKTDISVH